MITNQKLDIIWSLTLVCPWDCEMCCVDAVHVRRTRNGLHLRTDGLAVSEVVPVTREEAPDIYEFAASLRQARGLELTFDQKMRVLENVDGYDVKIDFSGGDPMVQHENYLVLREASRRLGQENVTLTSTGAGLSRLDTDALRGILGELNFTYDSPAAGVPGIRPAKYAASNLAKAAAFKHAGVNVRAECPLTTQNCDLHTLDGIYHSLREAGIAKLLVMRLFPSGRGNTIASRTPSPEQYRRAISHLRDLERDHPGVEVKMQCALKHLEPARATGENPCDLVRSSFGLLADGTLLASPWAVDGTGKPFGKEWMLGNLARDHLRDILDQDVVRAYMSRLDDNFGHCKIFSYLNSTRDGAERLFDRSDPLYIEQG